MLVAGVCMLAACGQVLAADLPVPAVQPPSSYFPTTPPTFWSGFYVGLNAGYAFGNSNWTNSLDVATGGFNTSGPMVGGTFGLNLQTGSILLGFETDGDWTGIKGSSSAPYCSSLTAGANCVTENTGIGTARVRLGYAFDRVLVYGTGGGALGNIRTGFNPPGNFDQTITFGWTAGLGVEVGFFENWSAKIEYLYLDLDHTACVTLNCGVDVPLAASFTQNIVRVGVNYRFGPW
jgi:outer membrane immunogenic protein